MGGRNAVAGERTREAGREGADASATEGVSTKNRQGTARTLWELDREVGPRRGVGEWRGAGAGGVHVGTHRTRGTAPSTVPMSPVRHHTA